jgi:hypothetical protein
MGDSTLNNMIKYTYIAHDKVQSLKIIELSSIHTEQSGRFILHCAGGRLVFAEGVGGNENDGGSYDAIVNQYNSFCHFLADAPESTIPAVVDRMVSVPYKIDPLIPQNLLAGEVVVIGLCNKYISSYKKKWKRLLMHT